MKLEGGFEGKLYRALNPIWAANALSGEGAARYGGRFNAAGVPALYCSLDALTALREANQVGDLHPTTLVAFHAAIASVFDGCSPEALGAYGLSIDGLGDPGWREKLRSGLPLPTHQLAERLIADGYAGLRVRSFARGSDGTGLNMVLWRWGNRAPHGLKLIDDERRLGG